MNTQFTTDTNKGKKRVHSSLCEGFINGCFELHDQGYILREGEVFASLAGYQAYFDEPSDETDPPVTPEVGGPIDEIVYTDDHADDHLPKSEEVSLTNPNGIDYVLVGDMSGDKKALDAYGETLGIKLNRSKTFNNMLKSLEKQLGV